MAQAVNVTPQHAHDSTAHDAAFRDPIMQPKPIPTDDKERQFRDIYVRQTDLDAFGYTPGCPRCDHAMRYGPNRAQMPHSRECRNRIRGELKGTVDGRRRLEEWMRRTGQQMAEDIQADVDRQAEAQTGQGEIGGDGQLGASSGDPAPLFKISLLWPRHAPSPLQATTTVRR